MPFSVSRASTYGRTPYTSTSRTPQTAQQVDVVRQLHEAAVRHQLAAKGDDKSLAAKAVSIGCR